MDIIRNSTRLDTWVYRKPTDTGLFLHYNSHVDMKYKHSLFKTMLKSGFKLSLNWQFLPFVFSTSRFQGLAFRCGKIVFIVTLLEAIEGIPDKDYNFLGNDKFLNLYARLLHEQKLRLVFRETYLRATTQE